VIDTVPSQLEKPNSCQLASTRRDPKDDMVRAVRWWKMERLVTKLATSTMPAAGERRADLTHPQRGFCCHPHEDRTLRRMQLEHHPRCDEREVREFDA
jgi:hypothetical protein